MGNVLFRLSFSGSAAWMPPINGPAILFSNSEPNRLRTNPARLSSSPSDRRGINISIPMRILPGQEISFDFRKGSTIVGAISIMPSGIA